jgi:hypothetical protein
LRSYLEMPNHCDRLGREDDSTRVKKRSIEHFGSMLCSRVISYEASRCSCSFSCSCSCSSRSSIAIWPNGTQVTANRLDQRLTSPQFKQPSSTSTVSLSTSTTKSDARHERRLGCTAPVRTSKALSYWGAVHIGPEPYTRKESLGEQYTK